MIDGPRNRIARSSPGVAGRQASADREAGVLEKLRTEFAVPNLATLPDFLVILEGATDRGYLMRAAELVLAATGADPLEVPESLRRGMERRVSLIVPGEDGRTASGGVDRMCDLAGALFGDFFAAEVPRGLLFVFDHDHAGRDARDRIKRYGFRPDLHSLTLDPAAHATLGALTEVVVEDLIALKAQEAFFSIGGAFCSKEYQRGVLIRIKWAHPSKGDLRKHICAYSSLDDLSEFVTLLSRIRAVFGFPSFAIPGSTAVDVGSLRKS